MSDQRIEAFFETWNEAADECEQTICCCDKCNQWFEMPLANLFKRQTCQKCLDNDDVPQFHESFSNQDWNKK